MATVTTLRTAAATPVINPRRKGRFPRGVVHISNAYLIRANRRIQSEATAKAIADVQGWANIISISLQKKAIAEVELERITRFERGTR